MGVKNSIEFIAIGSFDGVHIAHQKLISHAQAVVVIEKGLTSLTVGYKRSRYIDRPIFFYHFDRIKSLSAKEFVDRLYLDFPNLKSIIVGYDFRFGYGREGDIDMLKRLFYGEVVVISEVKYEKISVHSNIIRGLIEDGEMGLANRLLNRNYSIDGNIIPGQGLGREMLVPTLNLHVERWTLPKSGVYATKTVVLDTSLQSVSFLGHRVTTDGRFAIETHILDRDIGEIKEGEVSIEFLSFIRQNRRFNSLELLRREIKSDIYRAKDIIKGEKSATVI